MGALSPDRVRPRLKNHLKTRRTPSESYSGVQLLLGVRFHSAVVPLGRLRPDHLDGPEARPVNPEPGIPERTIGNCCGRTVRPN